MRHKLVLLLVLFLPYVVSAQVTIDCSRCSSELLHGEELDGLERFQLRRLKNEIYARNGYTFTDKAMRSYFSQFGWYRPLNDNSKVVLSDIELKNVSVIEQAMNENGEFLSNLENSKYRCLLDEEVELVFSDSVKKELGITYDIWKVYRYSDLTGDYYFVMTEHPYSEGASSKGFYYDKIRGINYKINATGLEKTFELNDYKDSRYEYDIHFWSRYTLIEDYDGDEKNEPIIIYGTLGLNGYDDARVKILIYTGGVKSAIRIFNSPLDYDRYIQVDKSFYRLPAKIQEKVIEQMLNMQHNEHCLYPHGWQDAMRQKKIMIRD